MVASSKIILPKIVWDTTVKAAAQLPKATAMAIGIEPSNWPHFPLGNGGVEVRFQFSREEDQVNAKLALV